MDSVIIVAPTAYDAVLKSRLERLCPVATTADGRFVVDDGQTRLYVGRDDNVHLDFMPSALARILSSIPAPVFYVVDFSDVNLCREVLEAIADDPSLLVDDDCGHILPGNELVGLLRTHPPGDWRTRP